MQTGERKQKAQFHCKPPQPLNYILRNLVNILDGFLLPDQIWFLKILDDFLDQGWTFDEKKSASPSQLHSQKHSKLW